MIEVRYAGAVIGRSAIVRALDTRGLFLGITEPMPVGTMVGLKVGDRTVPGRVAAVSEAQELARAGMRVTFSDPATAALFGTPVEAPPEVDAAPAAEAVALPQPAPPEATAPPAPDEPPRGQVTGPRRIVVDASTEHLAAETSRSPEVVPDEGEPSGPAHAGDGGRKNRRNKRR